MSTQEIIKSLIRNVPDFPKPGIMFRDITSLLAEETGVTLVLNELQDRITYELDFDKIVAIESRGFILGALLSTIYIRPLILARKPGKLPNETLTQTYSLEYGENALSIQKHDIKKDDKILIIDDVLATGGTALATCKIIEELGGKVEACYFLIELDDLKGRDLLENEGIKVISSIHY